MRKCLPISVIVPTYNRADYLAETLNAILSQQYQDLELIVVDDFSSDDSRNLLNSFKEKHPEIVLVFLKENLGESNAVNVGWSLATKQFISIVNSDDPPHKSWLLDMTTAIEENPGFGFYYPNRLVINENGHILREEILKEWSTKVLYENLVPIASAGLIIDRNSLPENFEPRDSRIDFPSDLIQMFRIGLLTKGYKVDHAWGIWREHSRSASGSSNVRKKANDFEESVVHWISQNEKDLKYYSREEFRTCYLYAHIWKILRNKLGFMETLLILAKSSLVTQISKRPQLLLIGVYVVALYFARRISIFSRRKLLYRKYSNRTFG